MIMGFFLYIFSAIHITVLKIGIFVLQIWSKMEVDGSQRKQLQKVV